NEIRYLRKVAGKTRRDRIRNSTVRQSLGIQTKRMVQNAQLWWFGHVNCMSPDHLPRRAHKVRCEGRKLKKSRCNSWMDITSTIIQRGLSVQSTHSLSMDRGRWSAFYICPTPQS
ncbi:hypothetical protein AAG570_013286, partial [Ranatra chinensis]